MEVKQKVEIPSLAVVLSIDRSGSMAMSTDEKVTKLDLAKEACTSSWTCSTSATRSAS